MKKLLQKFDSASLSRQVTLLFIMAIIVVSISLTVGLSALNTHIAVDRAMKEGISITEALANNSSLSLLLGSKKSAQEAVEAVLTFPGVVQVSVHDYTAKNILYQYGEVEPGLEQNDKNIPEKSILENENSDYWQFTAPVIIVSEPSEEFILEGEEPLLQVIGKVKVLISKDELKTIKNTIIFGSLSITAFVFVLSFFVLRRIIHKTTRPFAVLSEAMLNSGKGMVGLRANIKGARELTNIAKTFNDMMDVLEKNENELIKARDAALEASRLKSEFVANISHEIRTPMNGILGMLSLIDHNKLSKEEKGYIAIAKESGNLLLSLIDGILDFSKISVGKIEVEKIELNLKQTLENIIVLHSNNDLSSNLEMACFYDPDAPFFVLGDSVRLQQVFNNLIGNAIKFTKQGSVNVFVKLLEKNDKKVTLEIKFSDTGVGISEEFIPKLFDAYSQQDGSIKRRFGGTGLGLAICEKLVKLMGGTIRVESQISVGTDMILTIPFEYVDKLNDQALLLCEKINHCFLVSTDGVCKSALMDVAKQFGLSSTWSDSLLTFREYKLQKTSGKYLLVLINGIEDVDKYESELKYLRETYDAIIVRFFNPVLEKKRLTNLIDWHMTKPVRSTQLEQDLLSYFFKNGKAKKSKEQSLHEECKILLVEDNPVNQKVAKAMLVKAGYQVDIAMNGQQALDKLKISDYDLALMDCQMPVMDGYVATQAIRALPEKKSKIPIIALSANVSAEDQSKCFEVGMNGFIPKPFTKKQLESELKKWYKAS